MRKDLYIDLYEREESHWWHLSKRKLLFKLLNRYAKKGVCILDVGCGTGKNLEELGNFGKAEGVDNSSEAINFCKKRGLRKVLWSDSSNYCLSKKSKPTTWQP